MKALTCFIFVLTFLLMDVAAAVPGGTFRIGIVGLAHDHAQGFLSDLATRNDVELVGIAEDNPTLVARYTRQYQLSPKLFYSSLEQMLDQTQVKAVAVCSSTFDHARIVQVCAARGVNVMVEKPLAVNLGQARAIAAAAKSAGIQVVVNYETTWYPSTQASLHYFNEHRELGEIRKIVVHDGHGGPKEIGASAEFLAWLTDPVLNGGGALTDFGCYGANLITALMQEQRPTSVTAVTQTMKPDMYPKVDDEATIVLTYPRAQGIIQASWNWPYGRKDMEIYGVKGALFAPDRNTLRLRAGEGAERIESLPALEGVQQNSLTYFAAVARGEIEPRGLSSLQLNLIVTEILDAARESARTGKTVVLGRATQD